jgi:signal transduction histidine kinase
MEDAWKTRVRPLSAVGKHVTQKLFLLSLLALACIVVLVSLSVRELLSWNAVASRLGRQTQETMLDGVFYSATVRATAEAVSFGATGNADYANEAREALRYAESALAQLRRLAGGAPALRALEGEIGVLRRQQEVLLAEVRARVTETLRSQGETSGLDAARLATLYGPEAAADRNWTATLGWHERERQQSLSALRTHQYRLLWLVNATLVVGVVWVLALLAFVHRGIALPVNRLARAAERVATGDLDQQVAVSSDDEIGGLQEAFNRMVQDLRQQQSALAQQGQQLAHLVAAASSARGAAEHVDRAKTKFLANLSHEIRTPISGVLGSADLLLLTTLDAQQRHYAQNVRSCGETLLRLIDDMLDLAKIQTTALPHQAVPSISRASCRKPARRRPNVPAPRGSSCGARSAPAFRSWSSARRNGCCRCSSICSTTRSSSPRPAACSCRCPPRPARRRRRRARPDRRRSA